MLPPQEENSPPTRTALPGQSATTLMTERPVRLLRASKVHRTEIRQAKMITPALRSGSRGAGGEVAKPRDNYGGAAPRTTLSTG